MFNEFFCYYYFWLYLFFKSPSRFYLIFTALISKFPVYKHLCHVYDYIGLVAPTQIILMLTYSYITDIILGQYDMSIYITNTLWPTHVQ